MKHTDEKENKRRIEAFDRASNSYDRDFSLTALGREYRARVQERLDTIFKPGMLVLDIGCGTGDDAIHLAKRGISVIACDFSSGMLNIAEEKIKKEGMHRDIILRHLKAENLVQLVKELPMGFDGVFSNFGPLNMVEDLTVFVRLNAQLLDPGKKALHVVMGRKPLFEIVYWLLHSRTKRAFARWSGSTLVPVAGSYLTCRFYQPYEIAEAFEHYFSVDRIEALGLIMPPPYLNGHYRRRRKFYGKFKNLDKKLSRRSIFNTMGDHFIIEMTREPDMVTFAA